MRFSGALGGHGPKCPLDPPVFFSIFYETKQILLGNDLFILRTRPLGSEIRWVFRNWGTFFKFPPNALCRSASAKKYYYLIHSSFRWFGGPQNIFPSEMILTRLAVLPRRAGTCRQNKVSFVFPWLNVTGRSCFYLHRGEGVSEDRACGYRGPATNRSESMYYVSLHERAKTFTLSVCVPTANDVVL